MTPGRWAVLAVAVPVALALIGWTGFSLVAAVARGSYPFSYGVPVEHGQVALNVDQGNITLRQGAAAGTARLTGTVQYGLRRPDVSEWTGPDGANLNVSCSAFGTGDCGVNASLDVPPRTAITLHNNGGGDITAFGFASGVQLASYGGNITAGNLAGDIYLDTGGGNLTASALTGTLQMATEGGNVTAGNLTTTGTMRMDTGGGDFTVNGFTGDLQLNTEGGNVQANSVTSAVSAIQSGGGNVILDLTQAPQNLQITAMGGNVTVFLPPGSATYDIATPDTAGGNVSYPSSLASSASHRTITIDSGGGNISISQG
jgi:hypothetical protein